MKVLGEDIRVRAHVTLFSRSFEKEHRLYPEKGPFSPLLKRFSWRVRPTLITCCLPLLFVAAWVYLGWFA
jgi:hypothetical protein